MNTYGELLPGIKLIHTIKHVDGRGYFSETWKTNIDELRGSFRQLNTAKSSQHVLRGMHRQNQTKLVMPVYGRIFDVALDPESGKWFGAELDENLSMLIPPEYAHGYLVLSEMAIVQYIVDMPYDKALEENFKWDQYNIEWPTKINPMLSDKDK